VVAVFLGDAGRLADPREVDVGGGLDPSHPDFEFPDRRQIFVDLLTIRAPELGLQLAGVLGHEVEDALAVPLTLPSGIERLARAKLIGEQPLERQAGVNLLGHRRVLRPPGDV